ncbi:rod shape-determining protein [Spiroplasma endosymbiont of Panorpa germanica]|uniref:rod shape-determining protein n=1 Tax=Spiroplasma endosymbiont of Panorpa germanica TaxID=3066314 RepID=UPI0030D2035D
MAKQKKERKFIAMDFGSHSTRIYIEGLGIVFDEATVMALNTKTKKIVAIGNEASKLVGKINHSTMLEYPFKNGVIASIDILKEFLNAALGKYQDDLVGAIMLIACPLSVTNLERKALVELVKKLGAYYVQTEDDVKMAALGAGYDIFEPSGILSLDIGAGKATAGAISADGVISYKWTKVAGNALDEEIVKYIRARYNMEVGAVTGEKVKINIGTLIKTKNPLKIKVFGREVVSGMPKEIVLTDSEISKLVQVAFGNLTTLITGVLEDTPNELAGDIIRNGIIVTGAMSGIQGVKDFFEDFFEIPVKVAKNSATAVIDGAVLYKKRLYQQMEEKIENKESLYN